MNSTRNGAESADRLERPVRRFQAAVSAEAQALAWANREDAPHGAAVLVVHEVSPRGRIGRLWPVPAERTAACAVVLRPHLPSADGDAVWLVGGLAAAQAAGVVGGGSAGTWWPDRVVDAATGDEVADVKAQVLLGPGQVRFAVVTARFDLDRLGLEARGREDLLEAFLVSFDQSAGWLADGAAAAAAYERQCRMLGERVKLSLLPKGETRGVACGVDRSARLVLESATGMVEHIAIDGLREIGVVGSTPGA